MLSIQYATYEVLLEQGALAGKVDGLSCPRPFCCGSVAASERTCERGVVWLFGMEFVHARIEILLAVCTGGRKPHVVRVLPADILPKKIYSLQAIEGTIRAYREGGRGYRATLAQFSGEVPHFSTLYGWIGGMGRTARERTPEPPSGPSFAEVRQEIEKRFLPKHSGLWDEPVFIAPGRCCPLNVRRRNDLEGAVRLLRVAGAAFPEAPHPLTDLVRSLLFETDLVTVLSFWSRIREPPSNAMSGRRGG